MSILDEVKKGVVSAVYFAGATKVTETVHSQMVSLTSSGTDENGQPRPKNAVNRVIDTDVGRAGVSYAIGLGTQHLPAPVNSNSVVTRLGQTMRVNAFATVFTSALKAVFSRRK